MISFREKVDNISSINELLPLTSSSLLDLKMAIAGWMQYSNLTAEIARIILRHLVLPGHIECCIQPIIEWTKENIPNVRKQSIF